VVVKIPVPIMFATTTLVAVPTPNRRRNCNWFLPPQLFQQNYQAGRGLDVRRAGLYSAGSPLLEKPWLRRALAAQGQNLECERCGKSEKLVAGACNSGAIPGDVQGKTRKDLLPRTNRGRLQIGISPLVVHLNRFDHGSYCDSLLR
jgi:hypothetical protein